MGYPARGEKDWRAIERPSPLLRLQTVARSLHAEIRARRYTLPALHPVRGKPRPADAGEAVLLCVTKDAIKQLPALLAYYRALGIRRFAFVDDRSEDGSREWLESQADIDLFQADTPFRAAKGGLLWRDALVALYGRKRWYLSIDSDEYLVFPGMETRPLKSFIADLEHRGLKRAHAPMIDIYPDGRLGDAVADDAGPHAFPTSASPLFDTTSYRIANEEWGTAVRGGPRLRLYGVEMRMSKFPLLYADAMMRFTSGSHHGPLPLWRNFLAPQAVLLHHKFPSGAVEDFHAIARRRTHSGGSVYYRQIIEQQGFGPDADLRYEGSVRYAGSENMVRQGFMEDLRAPRP